MTIIAWPGSQPGVVYIRNPKCPRCLAEGKTAGSPVIVRAHSSRPHRRRGKSISKRASWNARYPLRCKGCDARLKGRELLAGTPFRFQQMEMREEDFYDSVTR